MRGLTGRLREASRAFADVFRNPDLRRLQLAWAGSITGQWAYSIAVSVYAYRHGGAAAVGLVAVLRTIPAAALAPLTSVLGDRLPRGRVMILSDLGRMGAIGGAGAVALLHGPAAGVYGLATLSGIVGTLFRPAEAALLPALARSPEELTAANVSSSTLEAAGSFIGPAVGALVLALTSTGVAFAFTAGTFLWSALLVARVRGGRERPPAAEAGRKRARTEVVAGFRTIVGDGKLRVVVGLYAAQALVAGAASVLIVVVALDLLRIGNSGVGYLNSAGGVGGIAGAALALALAARRRLAGDFGAGMILWGLPLLLVGIWPNVGFAIAMLAVVGVGNTLVDVAAATLLQRTAPDEVLARVFGVMASLLAGALGLGAILAPLLVAGLGSRGALVATGVFLPVLTVLLWRRLDAVDRAAAVPARQLELLRGIPMFAPLPAKTLERLAHALRPVHVDAGAAVVTEGELGDLFYVVDAGETEVLGRRLGPGGHFGEIALLRDVPRTATVTAATSLDLWTLERDEFLAAVTGHAPSRAAAEDVVDERLGVPASA